MLVWTQLHGAGCTLCVHPTLPPREQVSYAQRQSQAKRHPLPCFKCVEERNSRGRKQLSLNRNRHGVGKGTGSVEISMALRATEKWGP